MKKAKWLLIVVVPIVVIGMVIESYHNHSETGFLWVSEIRYDARRLVKLKICSDVDNDLCIDEYSKFLSFCKNKYSDDYFSFKEECKKEYNHWLKKEDFKKVLVKAFVERDVLNLYKKQAKKSSYKSVEEDAKTFVESFSFTNEILSPNNITDILSCLSKYSENDEGFKMQINKYIERRYNLEMRKTLMDLD
jgi:peptidyl-tRNA hydrolase